MNLFSVSRLTVLCLFVSLCQASFSQPVIHQFSPAKGPVGTVVTITGNNFDPRPENNFVYFGGMRAVVSAASSTQLKVVVPAGTTHKALTVTTAGLTAYSRVPFAVTFQGGDIIVANSFAEKKDSALEGTGYEPAIGDLDGDGKADVVMVGISNFPFTPFLVSVLRNTSKGKEITFAPPLNINSSLTPYRVAISDMDGDGKGDLVVLQYTGSRFTIYKNTSTVGNLSFTQVPGFFFIGSRPANIAVLDVDNDGRTDVVSEHYTPAYTLAIFRNTTGNGVISFLPKQDIRVGNLGGYFALDDVDSDGLPDLGVSDSETGRLSVMKNISSNGTVSFGNRIDVTAGGNFFFGDLDRDMRPDLVITRQGSVSVLKNSGTGTAIAFSPVATVVNAGLMHSLADINGDALPELLSYETEKHTVSITRNASTPGNVSFDAAFGFKTGNRPYMVNAGDLNNDGKPDIVTMNLTNTFTILRNKVSEPIVIPGDPNQATGNVLLKVSVDSTVHSYNGNPYVQRHYDIQPEIDPETSTATVTLYFTQSDFDNFNLRVVFENHKLPRSPSDVAGKANLRVYQYHGTSDSSKPGTYTGKGIEINPDDSKIIWNPSSSVWEVTFDIVGFSGFFISSSESSILPVSLLSFTVEQNGAHPILKWVSSKEVNTKRFELMKSMNAGEFRTIAVLDAKGNSMTDAAYQHRDTLHIEAIYYYKLKMIDIDGHYTFSKTISVSAKKINASFALFPNPASEFVVVKHPVSRKQSELRIIDMNGRVIQKFRVSSNATQTDLDIRGMAKGNYTVMWTDGSTMAQQSLLIK
jgi:hypothetical protein